MLSGGLNQNVGSIIGQTAACLPLTLYVTRRFLDRPSWSRTAVVAVGYAAVSLSSLPPVLIAIFGFTTFYSGWMIASAGRMPDPGTTRRRLTGRLLVAVVLSLGLSAFYYFPFLDLIRNSSQVSKIYHDAGLEFQQPICCHQLVSPTLLDGSEVFVEPALRLPLCRLYYVGIVPILAALWSAGTWVREGGRFP